MQHNDYPITRIPMFELFVSAKFEKLLREIEQKTDNKI